MIRLLSGGAKNETRADRIGRCCAALSMPALASPEEGSAGEKQDDRVMTTDSGVQYVNLVVGAGRQAELGDTATVHYTGWLADGTKFDSSLDRKKPFSFRVEAGGDQRRG